MEHSRATKRITLIADELASGYVYLRASTCPTNGSLLISTPALDKLPNQFVRPYSALALADGFGIGMAGAILPAYLFPTLL